MQSHQKAITLLILLNLSFAILFFIALVSLHKKQSFITIGLPYLLIDWFIMLLALISMGFVTYQIYKIR